MKTIKTYYFSCECMGKFQSLAWKHSMYIQVHLNIIICIHHITQLHPYTSVPKPHAKYKHI